jgi:hypothetical protein
VMRDVPSGVRHRALDAPRRALGADDRDAE